MKVPLRLSSLLLLLLLWSNNGVSGDKWCTDDIDFKYQGKDFKTCEWIGNHRKRINNLCAKTWVRNKCAVTCGVCCRDNDQGSFKISSGAPKKCNWLSNDKRRKKYCKKPWISRSLCPKKCGACCVIDLQYVFLTTDGKYKKCNWLSKPYLIKKYCTGTTKEKCEMECSCVYCLDKKKRCLNPNPDHEVLVEVYDSFNVPYQRYRESSYSCNWFGISCNDDGAVTSIIYPPLGVDLDDFLSFLTGSIPDSIGDLVNLKVLWLPWTNKLIGSIPESIGKLVNLEDLDLSSNTLTGKIPESIVDLVNLRSLHLYGNPAMTGPVPAVVCEWLKSKDIDYSLPYNAQCP